MLGEWLGMASGCRAWPMCVGEVAAAAGVSAVDAHLTHSIAHLLLMLP